MAKVILDNVNNLQNESSAVSTINTNSDRIEAAMEKTLSRDGTSPNEMNTDLDMNHHRIYNLPHPESDTEPVRLQDIPDIVLLDELIDQLEEIIDDLLNGSVPDGSVTTPKIVDGAVTTTKLADGAVTDIKVAALSKLANRRDDICDIRDYNANGSVDGGNATRFTEAFEAAYADNVGKNVTVNIPSKAPNGQPWLLESVTMGDVSMNSQGKVTFAGDGRWTIIKPAAPMSFLITQAASMNTLKNIMIDDTDNTYITNAAIYTTKAAMDGLPQYYESIFGLGCERLFRNDVADEGVYRDIQALNCRRPFDFNSGGVNANLKNIKLQGFEHGIVLNSDLATHPSRIHSEGLTISDFELLAGGSYPNAIGLWALDTLLLRMSNGVIGQMGDNGKGYFFDGPVGKGNVWARLFGCWADVGPGGWGFWLQGVNVNPEFHGCDVSYGGAGIPPGLANGWHIEDTTEFLINGGRTADPTNVSFGAAATVDNSVGIIRDVQWHSGTITQASSDINWDSDWYPPSAGREITSKYPRAGWTSYTPVVTGSGGTPFGAYTATGLYRRIGKTVTIVARATITTNGGAGGHVEFSLPIAAQGNISMVYQGSGREEATGNGLQARINSGTGIAIAQTYNGGYPGADGNVVEIQITYDCA